MNRYFLSLVLLLILLLLACEELAYDNPFDSNTELEPDQWAPANLSLEILANSQIQLSWDKSAIEAVGYKVERKISPQESFIEVEEFESTLQFPETNLQALDDLSTNQALETAPTEVLSEESMFDVSDL